MSCPARFAFRAFQQLRKLNLSGVRLFFLRRLSFSRIGCSEKTTQYALTFGDLLTHFLISFAIFNFFEEEKLFQQRNCGFLTSGAEDVLKLVHAAERLCYVCVCVCLCVFGKNTKFNFKSGLSTQTL